MRNLTISFFTFILIFGVTGCRSQKNCIELSIGHPGLRDIPRGMLSEAKSLIVDNVARYGNCYSSVWGVNSIAIWTYQITPDNSYLRISYLIYGEHLKTYVVEVENPTKWLSMADQKQIFQSEGNGDYWNSLDGPSAIYINRDAYMVFLPEAGTLHEIEMDPDWNLDSISYPFIRHTMMDERKYVFNPDICPFKGFRQYYNEVMDSVAAIRQRNMMNQQKQTE